MSATSIVMRDEDLPRLTLHGMSGNRRGLRLKFAPSALCCGADSPKIGRKNNLVLRLECGSKGPDRHKPWGRFESTLAGTVCSHRRGAHHSTHAGAKRDGRGRRQVVLRGNRSICQNASVENEDHL